MKKTIYYIGIITCVVYFMSVAFFIITQSDAALTAWELLTVISGPLILILLSCIGVHLEIPSLSKGITLAFAACGCALTGLAHIVNITVTRELIADGIAVPDYFQIGKWPSVEMAVDYLGWGFFIGLAFLALGLSGSEKDKSKGVVKVTAIICGTLCISGFFAALFINENLWYIAIVGYGVGPIIISVEMLRYIKIKRQD